MPYTIRELRAKIASNDYGAELCLQSAMANIEALERQVAALLRSDRRSAKNGMRNAVFVEFIQKVPGGVTKDDEFLSVKCDTVAQAIEVEALFHGADWVARVVALESVRSFPTAAQTYPKRAM